MGWIELLVSVTADKTELVLAYVAGPTTVGVFRLLVCLIEEGIERRDLLLSFLACQCEVNPAAITAGDQRVFLTG